MMNRLDWLGRGRWPRPGAAAATAAGWLLVVAAGVAGVARAAPFTPASDDLPVQRLPTLWDSAARRQRAELARAPQQLPLALATARAALDRARRDGDPRELGLAQAALAPWWTQATPPPPVRLLRATLRQAGHQFDAALADLQALLDDPAAPLAVQAQAGLTRAAVLQATGQLAAASQACQALQSARFATLGPALSVPARACSAELRSLAGQPRAAAAELAALAREAPGDRWLALVRAELAQRLGDDAAAGPLFVAATGPDAEVYALAAHADWLLDRGQAAAVLALLPADGPDADALQLRRTIALHQLRRPEAAAAAAAVQARFDAARQRGGNLHAREEARLALDVQGQSQRALALAQANWASQREPADAVLLWRAARAAGQPAAAQVLWAWVADPARVDVRLAGLPGRVAGARS